MSQIISPDNTELLSCILMDVKNRSYIDAVRDVQQQLSESPDVIDVPVQHHFAPGVYMRQMDAAAGTLVVSKMHRTEHFILFLTGSLSVLTENGIEHIKAPCIQRTMPGTKRVAYFHEDSTCMTIHPTESIDLEVIEKEVIVPEGKEEEFLISIGRSIEEFTS